MVPKDISLEEIDRMIADTGKMLYHIDSWRGHMDNRYKPIPAQLKEAANSLYDSKLWLTSLRNWIARKQGVHSFI